MGLKPAAEMTPDEILEAALEYQEKEQTEPEKIHHNAEVIVELKRRLVELQSIKDEDRTTAVVSFADSASTVICNLWAAHHGRRLQGDEVGQFAKLLFDFFYKVQ